MHEILNGLNPNGDTRLLAALDLLELLPQRDDPSHPAVSARAPEVVIRRSAALDTGMTRRHAGRLASSAGRAQRRE
jgi:hypothetical protein